MSHRWFRYYHDALDDPKVQRLTGDQFKAWINLLCMASRNDGFIKLADISFALRLSSKEAREIVTVLVTLGLFETADETLLKPHNWDARQYKSDVSNERVKRYRKRNCNVTVTDDETPPDTEQNTDTEKKKRNVRSRSRREPENDEFEKFWKAYPKRDGANPKATARKSFEALQRACENMAAIIAAAPRAAENVRGAQFIPMAATWLNQRRWEDHAATESKIPSGLTPEQIEDWKHGWRPGMRSSREIEAENAQRRRLEAPASLVSDSPPTREPDTELACGQSRQQGIRKLGSVLRETGLVSSVFLGGEEKRFNNQGDNSSMPVAGMDARHISRDAP